MSSSPDAPDDRSGAPRAEALRGPLLPFVVSALLLCLFGAFVHRGVLEAGFVNYDDPNVVIENEDIRDLSGSKIVRVFSEVRDQAYLPIYYASYWIDDLVFGDGAPRGYHLMNLLWHLLNGVLTFALWRRLLPPGRADLALAAAALFLVHPVVVESVAWVSSRKDLVSMAFLLMALLSFEGALRRGRSWPAYLPGLLLFVVGMFAKASILVGPFLAWCVYRRHRALVGRGEDDGFPAARRALGLWAVLGLATTLFHFFVARSQGTASLSGGDGLTTRVLGMVAVLGRYFRNLFFPFDLSVHYDVEFSAAFGIDHLNGLIALAILAAAGVFLWRKAGPVAFGFAWLGLSLLPFNNLFPRFSIAMADRYLYVGAAGFALGLLGLLFTRFRAGAWLPRVLALLLILGAASLTPSRVAVWMNSETLWRDALENTRSSAIPPIQLGTALETKAARGGKGAREALRESGELYELAVRRAVSPREAMQARLKLAPLLVRIGQPEQALRVFDRIEEEAAGNSELALSPEDLGRLRVSRASALLSSGRLDAARELLATVSDDSEAGLDAMNLRAFADIVEANAALQVEDLGDEERTAAQATFERGLELYREILERDPRHEKTRVELVQSLSVATWRSGAILEASRLVRELVDDFPKNAQARYLKARLYVEVDPEAAERDLKIAIRLEPTRVEPYLLYEQLLRTQGRNKEAIATLELGIRANPDSEQLEYAMSQSFLAFAYHHKNTGSLDLAFDAVGRSLRFSELNLEAYLLRAELMVQRTGLESRSADQRAADWEAAKADFEHVLEKAPDEPRARLGLAGYYRARGMAMLYRAPKGESGRALEAAAFDDLKEASRLAGDDPAFATIRQIVRNYEKNREARTRRDAERARQAKIEKARPIADRAEAALKERDYDKALELSEEALTVSGFAPDFYELAGLVRMQRGENRLAIANFELAAEGNPRQVRALFELGRLYSEAEEWAKTRDAFKRFIVVAIEGGMSEELSQRLKAAQAWVEYAGSKLAAEDGDPAPPKKKDEGSGREEESG